MAAPRILILCTWFPPVNAPGARRPYQLARRLVQRGWCVSVLTSTPENPTAPYGTLDSLHILRTPRTAATFDLGPVQRSLLSLLGSTRGSWINGPLRVLADMALPFRHGLRWNLPPAAIENNLGPQDVVLATSPDPTVFDIGSRLALRWNAVWAVDYRDPWNVRIPEVAKDIITHQGTGLSGALRRARMLRLEKRFCTHADLVTAVSKAVLANTEAVLGTTNGSVLHGGFDAGLRPALRLPGAHFILTHTGQLYPEQPWDVLFEALGTLKRDHPQLADRLRVRFVGVASTDPDVLRRLSAAAALTGVIEQLPMVDAPNAIAFQHDSDALLQLALTGRKGYLPVKFLEYLGAGRPILLLSAEQDEMEEALAATRTGTRVANGDELLLHLLELLGEHAQGRPQHYDPDQQACSAFEYARTMDRWADLLEDAMKRKKILT